MKREVVVPSVTGVTDVMNVFTVDVYGSAVNTLSVETTGEIAAIVVVAAVVVVGVNVVVAAVVVVVEVPASEVDEASDSSVSAAAVVAVLVVVVAVTVVVVGIVDVKTFELLSGVVTDSLLSVIVVTSDILPSAGIETDSLSVVTVVGTSLEIGVSVVLVVDDDSLGASVVSSSGIEKLVDERISTGSSERFASVEVIGLRSAAESLSVTTSSSTLLTSVVTSAD